MAENERQKKNYPPRKSQQLFRPPPGVQKAIQSLGVTDLREILDKKRQEGGSQDKKPDSNPPPPDPSYNILKDPTRDGPSDRPKPQKRSENDRYKKSYNDDRHQKSYNDDRHPKRSDNDTDQKWYDNNRHQKRFDNDRHQKPRDRDISHLHRENVQEVKDRRQQDNENKLQKPPDKGVLKKNQNSPQDEGEPKKELRFVEPSKFGEHPTRGERQSFRGRNARRGGGLPRESVEKKIENPINIKIELTTQTGQRNCILDENTKIADIKHVPDTPIQKFSRGAYRGTRGNFRSRGRGRGSFRGRGGFMPKKGADYAKGLDNFNNDKSQRPLHDNWNSKRAPPVKPENVHIESGNSSFENVHNESGNSSFEQNSQEINSPQSNVAHEDYDVNEEYDQENEEYDDANEHYNEEFSNDYQSEYENADYIQKLDDGGKSETKLLDPGLNETITITSSKFQDGEVKRSIDIRGNSNVTDEKQNEKSAEE